VLYGFGGICKDREGILDNLVTSGKTLNGTAPVDRAPGGAEESPEKLYLGLMKKCLTRSAFPDKFKLIGPQKTAIRTFALYLCKSLLSPLNLELVHGATYDSAEGENKFEWPAEADTMVGLERLDNLEACITDVIQRKVPGDLIETGVWRGGSSIFMRAVLKAYGDHEKIVWLADSFRGLPEPNPERYPLDEGDTLWKASCLAIPIEEVKKNFQRYDLLDDQVRFLEGWFRDTLPTAPIKRLAILRLDGDMYESTIDTLINLYPKLSPGGYTIVDDYLLPGCKAAVDDYRAKHQIDEPMTTIDRYAKFWRKLG
jgi:O-methyltransferase